MRTTAVSLELREASVFYGANRVLDRVSLSAAGGEFIALLGASGCGKTTLLRAICGFVGLASGSIVVGGQDVTRLSPEKRNIAMVFQSYALWPHMTCRRKIEMTPGAQSRDDTPGGGGHDERDLDCVRSEGEQRI